MSLKENSKVKIHGVKYNEDCEYCLEENGGVHICEGKEGFVLWVERGVAENPYGVVFDTQTCSFSKNELELV